jgi:hypothetical protein
MSSFLPHTFWTNTTGIYHHNRLALYHKCHSIYHVCHSILSSQEGTVPPTEYEIIELKMSFRSFFHKNLIYCVYSLTIVWSARKCYYQTIKVTGNRKFDVLACHHGCSLVYAPNTKVDLFGFGNVMFPIFHPFTNYM